VWTELRCGWWVDLADEVSPVGPRNKTGHPAHSHKRLKQVPAVNVNRIIITRCTALYLDALIDRQMVGFELWNVELDKPVI